MMDVFAADGDVEPTWIVGKGEAGDYRAGGAVNVVEGGGLCASRNMAIDLAAKAGKTCVQLSDDLLHMMVSICRSVHIGCIPPRQRMLHCVATAVHMSPPSS